MKQYTFNRIEVNFNKLGNEEAVISYRVFYCNGQEELMQERKIFPSRKAPVWR